MLAASKLRRPTPTWLLSLSLMPRSSLPVLVAPMSLLPKLAVNLPSNREGTVTLASAEGPGRIGGVSTYAQRGRGQRKRSTSGWASLTPTERHVVRLVSEGLANNDIGTRLFVSPRTVQTHLTHVYTKLGLTSRVQLAQEAARHG